MALTCPSDKRHTTMPATGADNTQPSDCACPNESGAKTTLAKCKLCWEKEAMTAQRRTPVDASPMCRLHKQWSIRVLGARAMRMPRYKTLEISIHAASASAKVGTSAHLYDLTSHPKPPH